MADKTHISWSDATWQIVTGCSIASLGCRRCYAMKLAGSRLMHHPSRIGLVKPSAAGPVWTGEVRYNRDWLMQPLSWARPRRIFVAAHGDLFHPGVSWDVLDEVFAVMALGFQHVFQVLTKRSDLMRAYLSHPDTPERVDRAMDRIAPAHWHRRELQDFGGWPLRNVWTGVSAENQEWFDRRVADLAATPSALRWVSAEPLLGPIDPTAFLHEVDNGEMSIADHLPGSKPAHHRIRSTRPRIDWMVVGGENAPDAKPMYAGWVRFIRDACAAAGVAFHFKQWGSWIAGEVYSLVDDGRTTGGHARFQVVDGDTFPGRPTHWWTGDTFAGEISAQVGARRAGRHLDGVEHLAFPADTRIAA